MNVPAAHVSMAALVSTRKEDTCATVLSPNMVTIAKSVSLYFTKLQNTLHRLVIVHYDSNSSQNAC